MTAKPITVWCVVSPDGEIVTDRLHETREFAFFEAEVKELSWWRNLYRRGYRCRRFTLAPMTGEGKERS